MRGYRQGRHQLSPNSLDIARCTSLLAPSAWRHISHFSQLGLPLKAVGSTNGAWRENLLFDEFADISRYVLLSISYTRSLMKNVSYVYLNFEPVDDWKLREATQANAKKIIDIVEDHIDGIHSVVRVSFKSMLSC